MARRPKSLRSLARRYGAGPGRVQTLLFPRHAYTVAEARAWAQAHGYHAAKVDVTKGYVRLRQVPPSTFRRMRTVPFGNSGLHAVVGWE